ncbi:MAG TPA: hypothetical protein VK550_00460 [Polyangiaceae bacterium]|nr:hypothetical protein [Polyangiaceae bacterium]
METKWLVRAASLAVMGSLTWSSVAEAQAPAPTPPQKAAEDEGPFAPKGKTGKLREAEQAELAPKPTPEAAPPKEKPYSAGADIVYGIGRAGSGTDVGANHVEFKIASIVLGVGYQADPKISARLRFPISTGSIDSADPGQFGGTGSFSASAVGNLEMAMAYTSDMGPHTKLPFDFALFLPVASGDRFPPQEGNGRQRGYLVNTGAQWSRGMEEDALFAPHRLSVVPRLSLRYATGGISTGGYVKTPLLLRMGGGDPSSPPDAYEIKSAVFQAIVGGDFHVDVSKNTIDVGTRAWLMWMSSDYIERTLSGSTATSKLQFALEPQIRGVFGQLKAVLGIILPIGGRLAGGDLSHVYGFRLGATYGF